MIVSNQPVPIQSEGATLWLTGLFMYGEEPAGEASAQVFLKEFNRGAVDFDRCTGSYRIRIAYPDGCEVYFADNAGIMRWYIGPKGFFTSLREAAPDNRTPDYPAVAQFLYYGCIYGTATPIQDVQRSDPQKYYLLQNNTMTEENKRLTPLELLEAGDDALEKQIGRLANALGNWSSIACSITGGTDSRAILSLMIYHRMDPILDITGPDSHPDVVIAKQIAEHMNRGILHVDDSPEPGWIDEAILAADGMIGVCGIYRLYKKAVRLQQEKISLECGGGAGEIYKNSFINQDYPCYGGKPNWSRFFRLKVLTYNPPLVLFGPDVSEDAQKVASRTLAWLSKHTGKNKANAYLAAGYKILQGRGAAICAMESRYYVPYLPMLERNAAAIAFHKNPYSLEMQAFQRYQTSHFCPEIKSIKTDRGLTCDSSRKTAEYLKSGIFLANVALGRILHRKKAESRIDTCFQEGLSSPQYYAALDRCKELGIIAPDAKALPMGIADRVFALGTIL